MKPIRVRDPRGVAWHLTLTNEIVRTEALERAVEQSNLTDREKKKRRARYGIATRGVWDAVANVG